MFHFSFFPLLDPSIYFVVLSPNRVSDLLLPPPSLFYWHSPNSISLIELINLLRVHPEGMKWFYNDLESKLALPCQHFLYQLRSKEKKKRSRVHFLEEAFLRGEKEDPSGEPCRKWESPSVPLSNKASSLLGFQLGHSKCWKNSSLQTTSSRVKQETSQHTLFSLRWPLAEIRVTFKN